MAMALQKDRRDIPFSKVFLSVFASDNPPPEKLLSSLL
jgi:hypothetical protein